MLKEIPNYIRNSLFITENPFETLTIKIKNNKIPRTTSLKGKHENYNNIKVSTPFKRLSNGSHLYDKSNNITSNEDYHLNYVQNESKNNSTIRVRRHNSHLNRICNSRS